MATMKITAFWDIRPWRWRQLVPPKRWYLSTKIHSSTSQKTISLFFNLSKLVISNMRNMLANNQELTAYTIIYYHNRPTAPCFILKEDITDFTFTYSILSEAISWQILSFQSRRQLAYMEGGHEYAESATVAGWQRVVSGVVN